MARYPLNLPQQLKQEAEAWARQQGISLNQFILWATAEKVGALNQQLDDVRFPNITYRRGASGVPQPVLRGTGLRVQTVVLARDVWQMTADAIAAEYEVSLKHVEEALAFYSAHQTEIDAHLAREAQLEQAAHG
jgi:uncharacterized protein (DUF433 family)